MERTALLPGPRQVRVAQNRLSSAEDHAVRMEAQVSKLQGQIADMQQQLLGLQTKAEEAKKTVAEAQEALDRASQVVAAEQQRGMAVDEDPDVDFTVGDESTRCGPPFLQQVYSYDYVWTALRQAAAQHADDSTDVLRYLEMHFSQGGVQQGVMQPPEVAPTQLDPTQAEPAI